ncbi:single-stranded DNA-binding protein [Nocardia vinacea]|uniref:single-stranded DNA-binding protein n=1 Tax=Nocardia vinacea TaxID=96468 RepID=UPI0033EA0174
MAGELPLTIVGNLCADPELRFLPNGQAVANVTIASTPRIFDKTANEFKDGEPVFMRGSVWRAMAESASESLTRGMRVIATGTLKQRSYEKDGEKRTVVEMDIEEIGPSLRYATAQVTKTTGNSGGGIKAAATGDAWSTSGDAPF